MIVKMPNGHIEVKARRRLKEPGSFEAFVEELQNTLIQLKESNTNTMVSDFDVSQNPTTPEQFEMLFNALALAGVKVQRFRLFGCPALNDEAMRHLTEHFSQDLTSESAPTELHLSDCAITTEGFLLLMAAIEEKELYPTTCAGRGQSLYLRLENNYIDEAVIQERVDAGMIKPFKKMTGARFEANSTAKVNLVVRTDGQYQQKAGAPPAPEDAPPPKEVYDSNWRGASYKPGWNSGNNWRPSGQAALPQWPRQTGFAQPRPAVVRPYGAQGSIRPGVQSVRPAGQWAQQAWPRGSAGTAGDRSRTPAGRGASNSGPVPPTAPPPKKKNAGLPHPWEEQWSDEYQIPYYWNSETGEALWEKPTA